MTMTETSGRTCVTEVGGSPQPPLGADGSRTGGGVEEKVQSRSEEGGRNPGMSQSGGAGRGEAGEEGTGTQRTDGLPAAPEAPAEGSPGSASLAWGGEPGVQRGR